MIFQPVEPLLAFRYMRSRREEGFISVIAWFSLLGITLGVATLIIVMSVMNGFRAELINRILGLNGHLGVYSQNGLMTEYNRTALNISELPGIIAATPQVEGQVMASSPKRSYGAVVRGVNWSDLAARKSLWSSLDEAALEAFRGGDGVLIGKTMAFRLGLKAGDRITLLSPKGKPTAVGTIPVRRSFSVSGIFEVGMHEYDTNFIFMPLAESQSFFNLNDTVSAIEIYAEDPLRARAISELIRARLGTSFKVFDWQDRNKTFISALEVERNVMFLILTLIIIVAAFNIVSSMIMMVRSKNADIAVLRSMGATPGMIMRIFIMTGASIGIVGTIIGTVLGILFCLNIDSIKGWIEGLANIELFSPEIYYLAKLPARIDPQEVLSVIAMALLLSFLASLYPAIKASFIAPAEVLRYE